MNSLFIITVFISLSIFPSFDVKASHAGAGELIYQRLPCGYGCISNNYRFIYKFYREVNAAATAPTTVTLCMTSSSNQTGTYIMTKVDTFTIGYPGIPDDIEEYRYSVDVGLSTSVCTPGVSWKFSVNVGFRMPTLNLSTFSAYGLYEECTIELDTCQFIFSNLPIHTPYVNIGPSFLNSPIIHCCKNQPFFYDPMFVIPDSGSSTLVYQSIQPRESNGCSTPTNIPYSSSSFTPSNPFPTNNTFNLNSNNGTISFTPAAEGTFTLCVKMSRYGPDFLGGTRLYSTSTREILVVVHSAPQPITIGDSICEPGTVSLSAQGTGTLSWYNSSSGGTLVNTGSSFNPTINSNTTYFVNNSELFASYSTIYHAGPYLNTIGSGLQSTLNQYLIFNVLQTCILQTVKVFPGSVGNVILELRNSSGILLNSASYAVGATEVGTAVTMPINWPLSLGNGYRIYRASSSVPLYKNSTGANYPYSNSYISITGNSVSPNNYYWAYFWTLSKVVNSVSCVSAATPVTGKINSCLNLTLFIQGYYLGTNYMTPTLLNQNAVFNLAACDSITVELRASLSPYNIVASTITMLSTFGTASCSFPSVSGSYYIVIRPRNAIETWSANPVLFSGGIVSYDFSNNNNKSYGNSMVEVDSGVWALYSGDLNYDENIDLLDMPSLENDINSFQFGYFATDLNGDGNVDLLDSPILEDNINNFIFSSHP